MSVTKWRRCYHVVKGIDNYKASFAGDVVRITNCIELYCSLCDQTVRSNSNDTIAHHFISTSEVSDFMALFKFILLTYLLICLFIYLLTHSLTHLLTASSRLIVLRLITCDSRVLFSRQIHGPVHFLALNYSEWKRCYLTFNLAKCFRQFF